MTKSELTRSELFRDVATVALGAVATSICNKNKCKVTILTATVTVVAVDIIAATRKKIKKNKEKT